MGRPKWWYGPEKRSCSNPPKQEEKPVCRRTADCNGCPFPSSGFICWSDNGECMRTRFEKLKETDKHDIRNYSEEYCTEKHRIAVCGFSAGGHLAASSGTLFNELCFLEKYTGSNDIRPDAMILMG